MLGAPYESLGKEILLSVWIAQRPWVAANGPTVAKFASAIHATALWGNHNQQKMLEMLAQMTKVDPALLSRIGRPVLGERLEPASSNR